MVRLGQVQLTILRFLPHSYATHLLCEAEQPMECGHRMSLRDKEIQNRPTMATMNDSVIIRHPETFGFRVAQRPEGWT
jgi:hypothetical protein